MPPDDYPADEWGKFVDYRTSDRFLRRSTANKANKDKQVIKVRHGRRNLAQIRYDNRDTPPIDLWKNLRSKDGEFTEVEAASKHTKMVNKKADPRNTSSEEDIVQEVEGERRGWTRGVGQKLPKSVFARASSSSSSSQPMYTADDVQRMFAAYTAPIFHKLKMTPPPIPFPGNVDSSQGQEKDAGDGNDNEVTDLESDDE